MDKSFLLENGHTLLLWTRKKTLTAALAAVVASSDTIKAVETFFMGTVNIKDEYWEFNLLPDDERKSLSAFVKAKYNALHYHARKTEKI